MKIGLFQFDIIWEDKEQNKLKILSILEQNRKDFDWLVFPEMTLTGFSMQAGITILDKSDLDFFANLAKSLNCNLTFGGNINGNNTSVTLSSEGFIINEYKKNHLFSFAGEDENYIAGKSCSVFKVGNIGITPAICYDLRFSYHFWSNAINTGIFCIIANWPESRKFHWRTLLCARAIENQTYVVATNRVGKDPLNGYSGNSMIIDPLGQIILEVENQEGIFVASIDPSIVTNVRNNFQFLNDRKF
jgi:predicted amidohydrolase